MYDIIGDIHGHCDELIELLELLGYEVQGDCFRHPKRTALFVGDFIDRGPQIRKVLKLVRRMVEGESAKAVMGNHEFNALAYHCSDPKDSNRYLRDHSEKNRKQHEQTIRQLPVAELPHHLEWFRQLPMWLDLGEVRIVHACWDPTQMSVIERAFAEFGAVSTDFLCEATTKGTPLFGAIEDVLKGKETELPAGMTYFDKDGNERGGMRIQWYRSARGETYASYALSVDEGLPEEPLPAALAESVTPYPASEVPVFFGHYWLRAERPTRLSPNVACVDYSVAKAGMLCAYRWDGERELSDDKFFYVKARDR